MKQGIIAAVIGFGFASAAIGAAASPPLRIAQVSQASENATPIPAPAPTAVPTITPIPVATPVPPPR